MRTQAGRRDDPLALGPVARLRPRDVVTLARTLAWYGMVRLALALAGFRGVTALFGLRSLAEREMAPGAFPRIEPSVRRAARGAQRVLAVKALRVTCIPRAAVLERILTAHGVPADLVVGVLTDQGFRAHAWLEVEGNVIGFNETGSKTWQTIARFRSTRTSKILAAQ